MTEKFSRWDNADYLKTEEDVALYLQACIDEDPGDGSLVRAALGDIARAEGMSQVAQELDARYADYLAHPEDGISWAAVKSQLLSSR